LGFVSLFRSARVVARNGGTAGAELPPASGLLAKPSASHRSEHASDRRGDCQRCPCAPLRYGRVIEAVGSSSGTRAPADSGAGAASRKCW